MERPVIIRRLPSWLYVAVVLWAALTIAGLLSEMADFGVSARSLESRLQPGPVDKGQADQINATGHLTQLPITEMVEVVPERWLTLPGAAPLAADGEGTLLSLHGTSDGYAVFRHRTDGAEAELVYRRKGEIATSITIGPDGRFCVGLHDGIDCISADGTIAHHKHAALTNVLSLAFAPDGRLWVLRNRTGPGRDALELVRIPPGLDGALTSAGMEHLVTMRQGLLGYAGNGLTVTSDGSAYLPIIEDDRHRILRIEPSGALSRLDGFWNLAGGIVSDATGRVYSDGVKRPQSLQEQQSPVDVVYVSGEGDFFATRFPVTRGDARLLGYMALGGDGVLYVTRQESLMTGGGVAERLSVVWRVPTYRPSHLDLSAKTFAYRIPFIHRLVDPRLNNHDYTGPIMIAPGQPLVVEGLNFDGKPGERRVLVGGVPAAVVGWSDDQLMVMIPEDAQGGEAPVKVSVGSLTSDSETMEVKTSDVPGWFQIGSQAMRGALANNLAIPSYSAQIELVGTTDAGESVVLHETMTTPGLYHVRLPNGAYTATYSAAYVYADTRYDTGNEYIGSVHIPVQVPRQAATFRVTDDDPIVVWMPDMLGLDGD